MTIKILISALCLIYVYVAIKTIIKIHKDTKRADEKLEQLIMELESIEALEQEPKRGKWIDKGDFYVCSECGERMPYSVFSGGSRAYAYMSDYCPHCGSAMEVESDTE